VCVQDYCKSSQPISSKLGVMIGLTNRKNNLTFVGAPFHCGLVDFKRFISICSICHTLTT